MKQIYPVKRLYAWMPDEVERLAIECTRGGVGKRLSKLALEEIKRLRKEMKRA